MSPNGKNALRKPWLTPKEQVEHLKSKGVRFRLMSEEDAVGYLTRNNNYFRLRSYRTGFPRVAEGARKGEYINLDFKMLVDLSIVDMLLRKEMFKLAVDVEHFAKVQLLCWIEAEGEDGYAIVLDFLKDNPRCWNSILKGKSSVYISGILNRYPKEDMPVWAFLEIISFGVFCRFYEFCAVRFNDRRMGKCHRLLMEAKSLRNACAHNNCILNDLRTNEGARTSGLAVTQELARVPGIGKSQRHRKMRNERISQIVTVLYLHKKMASCGVREHAAESLGIFAKRMNKHLDYYKGVDSVVSTFSFLTKVLESWYPVGAKEDVGCN